MTKDKSCKILINEIRELYQIEITDLNENLLSPRLGISEADFLYLFENLREKYGIDVYPVLAQNDSAIFCIDSLSQKIADIYTT